MILAAAIGLLVACTQAGTNSTEELSDVAAIGTNANPTGARGFIFPPPPAVPDGELTPATSTAVDRLVASAEAGLDFDALDAVAASDDARLALGGGRPAAVSQKRASG